MNFPRTGQHNGMRYIATEDLRYIIVGGRDSHGKLSYTAWGPEGEVQMDIAMLYVVDSLEREEMAETLEIRCARKGRKMLGYVHRTADEARAACVEHEEGR